MQVDPDEQAVVVEKFLTAVSTGDLQGLLEVLAPDVVAIADGGGIVRAARKPIVGAEVLASLLVRFANIPGFTVTRVDVNAMPGLRIEAAGATVVGAAAVEDGRITHIYGISNPHKLGRMGSVVELRR